jgi:hypothetical protein
MVYTFYRDETSPGQCAHREERPMKAAKRNQSRERCFLVSLLFLIVFNYPLVLAFNRTTPVFGIPLVILHLLGGWLLFIVVIFLIVRNLGRDEGEESPKADEGRNRP